MHRRAIVIPAAIFGLLALAPVAHGGGLPPGDARAEGFSPEGLSKIGKLLDDATARRQIAGGAALVARNGKVVLQATSGQRDAEAGLAVDESTIYRIASMTKPVTSVAVMMLFEEGKLGLNDPVSRYMPEFQSLTVHAEEGAGKPATVPAHREITIADLLTHTSGLSYRFMDAPGVGRLYVNADISDGLSETPGTVGENVTRLAKLPLLRHPGEAWNYGLSTDVLGRVVEVVSGRTLDEFFRERILQPLKMEDTSFRVPTSKRSRLAAVSTPGPGGGVQNVKPGPIKTGSLVYSSTYPTSGESAYFSGGAGLCSTIGDYARFLQMLLNRGELDGTRLLKPETVDLMTRNQIGDLQIGFANHGDGFGYGFGVLTPRGKTEAFRKGAYNDVASVGSYSWGGFFFTYFWVDPSTQLFGILMTQIVPSDQLKLREEFKGLVYEALSPSGAAVSTEEFARFAKSTPGDPARGRALFTDAQRLACTRCHKVRGEGGEVGPDLSDVAGKLPKDLLIEAVLEPSRQIVEGYRSEVIATSDGKVFTAVVKAETHDDLTLVDAENRKWVVKKAGIEERKPAELSIMPSGLASNLTRQEFADLVSYLDTLRPPGQGTPGSGITGPSTLPKGFVGEPVVARITGATAMDIAPDGRIFVCEQTGALRVVKGGALLPEPFVKLDVDSHWERGLIGVALDPDFDRNGHVYVNAVAARPYPHHRILRFTARGDVAEPGSEVVLFEGDDQTKMGGGVPAGHQGGAIHFGKDGKLYVALGEQTAGEPSQRLDSLLGKILRLNRDGSIPDDNPFADKTSGKYRAIWAMGLRNPFTFAFQPGSGRMFINDVGQAAWEEVDEGFAGANYGWPAAEGPSTDPRFRRPIHSYPVASVSGAAFCPPESRFPSEYRNQYFFMDFVKGWIKTLDPDHPERVETFATGLTRPVDLRFSPDGALYVLLRDAWVIDGNFRPTTGTLLRIRPDTPTQAAAKPAGAAIRVSDVTIHGDMDCIKVETPTATYVYGKRGAGFASLLDKDGHDWIAYQPDGKALGEYRGLPKCGQPTKFFHCGYGYGQYKNDNPFTSRVTLKEEGHVRVESETRDGKSACAWDFYSDHATMTLLRIDLPTYWFLYEGTPGGKLDAKTDFVIRPDGTRTSLDEPWSQNVPWVCFGAAESPFGMVLVNHQKTEPAETDSYVSWPFEKDAEGSYQDMTVFGFGRKGFKELVQHVPDLKTLPARFSIAFVDRADHASAKVAGERILSAGLRGQFFRLHWFEHGAENGNPSSVHNRRFRVNAPEVSTHATFGARAEARGSGMLQIFMGENLRRLDGAELSLEIWGGHPGTANRRVGVNGRTTYLIDDPGGDANCTHLYPSIPLKLTDLVDGYNAFQFACDQGTTFWGHYIIDEACIRARLRRDDDELTRLGLNHFEATVVAEKSSADPESVALTFDVPPDWRDAIARVEFQGRYLGYDENGDGRENDWHGFQTHREPRGHLGTANVAPFEANFDLSMLPDQRDMAVRATVRFKEAPELVYITPERSGLGTPDRHGAQVRAFIPADLPHPFWSRAGRKNACAIDLDVDTDRIERAELHLAVWDGGRGTIADYFTLNGHSLPVAAGGKHDVIYSVTKIDPARLRRGSNRIELLSDTEHHGLEVLFPGPALVVRTKPAG